MASDEATVRVLEGAMEVTRHDRCRGRRQRIEDAAHRAEVVALLPATTTLKGRDRLRAELPGVDVLISR